MDLFNRYLMRASGEKRFQPTNAAERATYAVLSLMTQNGMSIPGATEEEKSRFVDALENTIAQAVNGR